MLGNGFRRYKPLRCLQHAAAYAASAIFGLALGVVINSLAESGFFDWGF
jgi:hypothetical protein